MASQHCLGLFWRQKNIKISWDIDALLYFLVVYFQAAFECMYTLLDSCLDRIDIFEFLKHVEDGLNDHYDIKMLTYLMLVRLAHLCPNAVLQRKYSATANYIFFG